MVRTSTACHELSVHGQQLSRLLNPLLDVKAVMPIRKYVTPDPPKTILPLPLELGVLVTDEVVLGSLSPTTDACVLWKLMVLVVSPVIGILGNEKLEGAAGPSTLTDDRFGN